MDVSWTSGNGASRIIVAKAGSAPTGTPADGTSYTANATYGTGGTALGDGYVVYNGSGSSFTLTGLSPSTTYYPTSLAGYHDTTGSGPVNGIAGAWGTIIPTRWLRGSPHRTDK